MSIDERLPMQREEERRRIHDVASQIEAFFQKAPRATWDLAIAPAIRNVVVDALTPGVRGRLRHVVPKDLVNLPHAQLLSHFPTT
jgi:hypothetical protein